MFPAETFRDTLVRLAAILNRLGIRFHLTGGVSTIAYGEPRMTQDIDVVVDPRRLAVCRGDLRHVLRRATAAERTLVERHAADLGLASLLAEVLSEPDVVGP